MWAIDFISEEDFYQHVTKTIEHYGAKLKPIDVKAFNSNIIDPIKMIFDKSVYGHSWKQIIDSEIFRQRDKGNANEIGYFHQLIFSYMDGCYVPPNGKDGGWDVIINKPGGYSIDDRNYVHKIYVELKNKHNTMNAASASKTYIKCQDQLLKDDDCACFLAEAIAKKSQNIPWTTTVDGRRVHHSRIRRVSLDNLYEIITGEPDAFYQICMVLPDVIDRILQTRDAVTMPHDTVYEELLQMTKDSNKTADAAMIMAIYLLGFSTYTGFRH